MYGLFVLVVVLFECHFVLSGWDPVTHTHTPLVIYTHTPCHVHTDTSCHTHTHTPLIKYTHPPLVTHTQRIRPYLSREETELADVEKAMEENLITEHQRPERIVGTRLDAEGVQQYLVKVNRGNT